MWVKFRHSNTGGLSCFDSYLCGTLGLTQNILEHVLFYPRCSPAGRNYYISAIQKGKQGLGEMKGLAKWHSESRILVVFSAAEIAATFAGITRG